MIDQLFNIASKRHNTALDSSYSPELAITGKQLSNEEANRLTVLFPPWHGGGGIMRILARRLERQGSAVLNYSLHDQILEPNIDRVVESFTTISATVVEDVKELATQPAHRYKRITFVGASLGNVPMAMAAEAFPDLTDATIVVPGSNLAKAMWNGNRTQDLRRVFEEQGVTEGQLDLAWDPLAPKQHAAAFAGKQVRVLASLADHNIQTTYQHEMISALYETGAQLNASYSNVGHTMRIAAYCLLGSIE